MGKSITVQDLSKCFYISKNRSATLRGTLKNFSSFRFEKKKPFWALRNVSFEVNEGEVLGIIGPNGSGKSTLLKIISKITAPTEGRVEITGKVNTLLEVGTGFHPELTGRENVYLNGSILGMKRREIKARFDEIVEFAEISDFLDTPVKHYSSGMYVRLAFSVAAHLNPDVLIVDEVLSVGDAAFRKKSLLKMEHDIRQGRTVLFVSHRMETIQRLCNRVLLMEQGQVKQIGPADEVIQSYLNSLYQHRTNAFSEPDLRQGSGAYRFELLLLLDNDGLPTTSVGSGDAVTFKIQLQTAIPAIKGVYMRILIKSSADQITLGCISSMHVDPKEALPSSQTTFLCSIEKLPLNAGRYFVELEGFHNGQLADAVSLALEFEVFKAPFYPSGNLPSPQIHLLGDYKWSIST